jgi:hypothetical protein
MSRSSRSLPVVAPESANPTPAPSASCELCGGPVWVGSYTHEVFDASDVWACADCIEEMLNARADDAGCEMGMVGGVR